MYLFIEKLRKSGYIPFFIIEDERPAQALIALIQEVFINGLSFRKIERLARSFGHRVNLNLSGFRDKQGSIGTAEIFSHQTPKVIVSLFMVDALYEKFRDDGRVISMPLMIAYGIKQEGKRDTLVIEPIYEESGESWREFFRKLKRRGVQKTCLCISDAHLGIQKALKKE